MRWFVCVGGVDEKDGKSFEKNLELAREIFLDPLVGDCQVAADGGMIADHEAFDRVIATGLERVGPDDSLIIYITCHGHTDASGWLWLKLGENQVSISRLMEPLMLRKTQGTWNPKLLVIVEACYSGGAVQNLQFRPADTKKEGLAILASSELKVTSLFSREEGDTASVFTRWLHRVAFSGISHGPATLDVNLMAERIGQGMPIGFHKPFPSSFGSPPYVVRNVAIEAKEAQAELLLDYCRWLRDTCLRLPGWFPQRFQKQRLDSFAQDVEAIPAALSPWSADLSDGERRDGREEAAKNENSERKKELAGVLAPPRRVFEPSDIDRYRRVALIGDPGSGKSWQTRRVALHFASQAIQSLEAGLPTPIPIYAPLALLREGDAFVTSRLTDIAAGIAGPEHAIETAAVMRLLIESKQPIIWLLDGFDEIATVADQTALLEALARNSHLADDQSRVLITSRMHRNFLPPLAFRTLRLLPLTFERARRFCSTWLDHVPPMLEEMAETGFGEIIANPMFLTFVCSAWEANPKKRFANANEVYDTALQGFIAVHSLDRSTGRPSPSLPESTAVITELEELANDLLTRGVVNDEQVQIDSKLSPEVKRIAVSAGILEDLQGKYRFGHRTFSEYLAATYLAKQSPKPIELLKSKVWDPNQAWTEVWRFFVGALPNAESAISVLKELRKGGDDATRSLLFVAARSLSNLQQGWYSNSAVRSEFKTIVGEICRTLRLWLYETEGKGVEHLRGALRSIMHVNIAVPLELIFGKLKKGSKLEQYLIADERELAGRKYGRERSLSHCLRDGLYDRHLEPGSEPTSEGNEYRLAKDNRLRNKFALWLINPLPPSLTADPVLLRSGFELRSKVDRRLFDEIDDQALIRSGSPHELLRQEPQLVVDMMAESGLTSLDLSEIFDPKGALDDVQSLENLSDALVARIDQEKDAMKVGCLLYLVTRLGHEFIRHFNWDLKMLERWSRFEESDIVDNGTYYGSAENRRVIEGMDYMCHNMLSVLAHACRDTAPLVMEKFGKMLFCRSDRRAQMVADSLTHPRDIHLEVQAFLWFDALRVADGYDGRSFSILKDDFISKERLTDHIEYLLKGQMRMLSASKVIWSWWSYNGLKFDAPIDEMRLPEIFQKSSDERLLVSGFILEEMCPARLGPHISPVLKTRFVSLTTLEQITAAIVAWRYFIPKPEDVRSHGEEVSFFQAWNTVGERLAEALAKHPDLAVSFAVPLLWLPWSLATAETIAQRLPELPLYGKNCRRDVGAIGEDLVARLAASSAITDSLVDRQWNHVRASVGDSNFDHGHIRILAALAGRMKRLDVGQWLVETAHSIRIAHHRGFLDATGYYAGLAGDEPVLDLLIGGYTGKLPLKSRFAVPEPTTTDGNNALTWIFNKVVVMQRNMGQDKNHYEGGILRYLENHAPRKDQAESLGRALTWHLKGDRLLYDRFGLDNYQDRTGHMIKSLFAHGYPFFVLDNGGGYVQSATELANQ